MTTALAIASALAGGITTATGLRSLGRTTTEQALEPAEEAAGLGLGRGRALRSERRTRSRSRGARRGWTTLTITGTAITVARTAITTTLPRAAAIAATLAEARLGTRLVREGAFRRSRTLSPKDRAILATTPRSGLARRRITVPARFRTLGFRRWQDGQLSFLSRSCRRRRGRSHNGSRSAHRRDRRRRNRGGSRRGDRRSRSNERGRGHERSRNRCRGGCRRRLGLPWGERILILALSDNHLDRGRLVIAARGGGGGGGGSRVAALAAREAGTTAGTERSGGRCGRRAGGLGGGCG